MNIIKDLVCKIDVFVVKFFDLWDNYVSGVFFKLGFDDKGDYDNQCVLCVSVIFYKVGI